MCRAQAAARKSSEWAWRAEAAEKSCQWVGKYIAICEAHLKNREMREYARLMNHNAEVLLSKGEISKANACLEAAASVSASAGAARSAATAKELGARAALSQRATEAAISYQKASVSNSVQIRSAKEERDARREQHAPWTLQSAEPVAKPFWDGWF